MFTFIGFLIQLCLSYFKQLVFEKADMVKLCCPLRQSTDHQPTKTRGDYHIESHP